MKRFGIYFLFFIVLFSCETTGGTKGVPLGKKGGKESEGTFFKEITSFEKTKDPKKLVSSIEEYGVDKLSENQQILYANALFLNGDPQSSKEELNKILQEDSKNVDAIYTLALIAAQGEDERDLSANIDKVLAIDPNHSGALFLKGDSEYRKRNYSKANDYLRKSLISDPQNVVTLVKLATVNELLNNIELAFSYIDIALKISPDYSYLYTQQASLHLRKQEIPETLDSLSKAIKLEPDNPWNYLDRAMILVTYQKDKKSAQKDIDRVLALDPNNIKGLAFEAGIAQDEYKFDRSKEFFQKILAQNPKYYYAFSSLAEMAVVESDFEAASEYLSQYFELSRNDEKKEFYLNMLWGVSLQRSGKKDEALNVYRKITNEQEKNSVEATIAAYFENRVSFNSVLQSITAIKNPYKQKSYHFYLGLFALANNSEQTKDLKEAGEFPSFNRESWMASALLR